MQDDRTETAGSDGDGRDAFHPSSMRIAAIRNRQGPRVRLLRSRLLGILGLLLLLDSQPSFTQEEPEDRFSENLTVVERTVFIDAAALPTMGSVLRKSDADFLVLIDGVAVELADPAGSDTEPPQAPAGDPAAEAAEEPPESELASLTHIIWLDTDLASPPYVAGAANLLANVLPSLPASERITLVEMGRDTSRVLENLSRTELSLWLRRLAARSENGHAPPATTEQRLAALNRLAIGIPRLSTQDLGALWLISEPWPIEPIELEAILRTDAGEAPERSALGTLQRTSRILASDGWVVFPVSRRNLDRPDDRLVPDEGVRPDGFSERSPSPRADRPVAALPILISRLFGKRFRQRHAVQRLNLAQTLELATEIRLTPVAMLARGTTGALAGDPIRVGHLAERLRSRRRLVVKDPNPGGENLRRLQVVWIGGDGRAVPALPWVASRTSREIGIARLLSVVDSSARTAGQLLRVRLPEAVAGGSRELCFAYPRNLSPVRLLWWSEERQEIEIGAAGEMPEDRDGCADLPADLDDSDVVVLEALDSTEWGAGKVSALFGR